MVSEKLTKTKSQLLNLKSWVYHEGSGSHGRLLRGKKKHGILRMPGYLSGTEFGQSLDDLRTHSPEYCEDQEIGEENVKVEGMPKRYKRHAPRGTQ